jgi:hypothetical protein
MALWHWIVGGIGAWYLLKPATAGGVVTPTAPSGRTMSIDESSMFGLIENEMKSCAVLMDVVISGGYTTVTFTANNQNNSVARPTSTDIVDEAKAFASSICSGG